MHDKMTVQDYSFGSVTIDGKQYTEDIVVDRGKIKKRKKKASKPYRSRFGHTPLSTEENIPWQCRTLVIGRGASSSLPIMDEVTETAGERNVELVLLPTADALHHLNDAHTNLVLHLTC